MNNEPKTINDGGAVQAISSGNGYKFFVECDVVDDIFLVFLDDLSEEQAESYAKVMSIAWDSAIEHCGDSI